MRANLLVVALVAAAGCGGDKRPAATVAGATRGSSTLPDVRTAKDRPPVVVVSRGGDPAGAVAVAVTTAGLEGDDDPESATALAGLVEARLAGRGVRAIVTPAWDGFRAAVLVETPAEARAASAALRAALTAEVRDEDLAGAQKKLAALGARPLQDAALTRWARCVGSPYALPARVGKGAEDLAIARLAAWKAAAHVRDRVAFGVAGPAEIGEAVAADVAQGAPWRGAPIVPGARPGPAEVAVDVYEAATEVTSVVHATLDVASSSAAVTAAEALGDPRGPLATRLAALDVPFRLREVTGTAHAHGGCVGVVLEASNLERPRGAGPGAPKDAAGSSEGGDLAARVADAIALVHVEARVILADGGAKVDGRALARRAGDARQAAERAAWWALADAGLEGGVTRTGGAAAPGDPAPLRGSVALGLAARRGASPASTTREALAAAIARASAAWERPAVEGRTRVEPGQGEVWVLFASPCGTDAEGDVDAGLTALAMIAASEAARTSPETRVEPWVVADGAGLLVHGPALPGETPSAHARRLADIAARSFAAEALAPATLARARAELFRRDAEPGLGALAAALAPGHPSWVLPSGRDDGTSRASDAAILARAQALRTNPLRVGVLANVDAAQGTAALRAADRWVDRHGDPAACRAEKAGPPRPGTYAVEPRSGAAPEAYLAFPFPAGDPIAHNAALTIAAALDGEGGLLDKALAGGLARASSARLLGWPRAPALAIRVASTQGALDGAVMQVRALLDRLHAGGLSAADHERAAAAMARTTVTTSLDPRARVVATWRGDPAGPAPVASAEEVRAFATKHLGEDALVVIAVRPGRIPRP